MPRAVDAESAGGGTGRGRRPAAILGMMALIATAAAAPSAVAGPAPADGPDRGGPARVSLRG